MKPKSEKDYPFCVAEKATGNDRVESCTHHPVSWHLRKGRGGRKKRISTQGYGCPNPKYEYFGIRDEQMFVLIGFGNHVKGEADQDFYCQCCNRKFSDLSGCKKCSAWPAINHSQSSGKVTSDNQL